VAKTGMVWYNGGVTEVDYNLNNMSYTVLLGMVATPLGDNI